LYAKRDKLPARPKGGSYDRKHPLNTGRAHPVTAFFGFPETGGPDEASAARFLRDLSLLPPDQLRPAPVLADLGTLRAGIVREGVVRERLERRYIRIRFVQEELGRLDFRDARPGAGFEDCVFARTDFSIYKRLDPETFSLFSAAGLADYGESFFESAFHLNRKAVGTIIAGAYWKIDSCHVIRNEKLLRNPLFLSIMRSIHTSQAFAPLIEKGELLRECSALIRLPKDKPADPAREMSRLTRGFDLVFAALLKALHGVTALQEDGTQTELSALTGQHTKGKGKETLLRGTFYPHNKACTIPLASSLD
jgi:hypothetical protein